MKMKPKRCQFTAVALAVFSASLVASGVGASDSDWIVNLQWAMAPYPDTSGGAFWNGTALYEMQDGSDVPIQASFFTNGTDQAWSVGLMSVGTGAWSDKTGWMDVSWIDTCPYIRDTKTDLGQCVWIRQNGAPLEIAMPIPINFFGDWHDLSSQEQARVSRNDYYLSTWATNQAMIVFRDLATGMAHALSETPGHEEAVLSSCDILDSKVSGLFSMSFVGESLWPPGSSGTAPLIRNLVQLVVSTPSRKVYIGPQIPPYCIWMADFGLTREELAQYPATRVQAAFAARVHPSDKSLDATLLLLQ